MEENKSKDADFDFEIEECTEEKVKDKVNEKFEVENNSAEKKEWFSRAMLSISID